VCISDIMISICAYSVNMSELVTPQVINATNMILEAFMGEARMGSFSAILESTRESSRLTTVRTCFDPGRTLSLQRQ
jgi:hypothetical protein